MAPLASFFLAYEHDFGLDDELRGLGRNKRDSMREHIKFKYNAG